MSLRAGSFVLSQHNEFGSYSNRNKVYGKRAKGGGAGRAIKEGWHDLCDYLKAWKSLPDFDDYAPPLCDTSLFILPKHGWVRCRVIVLVHWKVFEMFTLLVILANCVTLAMDSKAPDFASTTQAKQLALADYVFTGFYTVEALLKIGAWGFLLAPNTYMRSGWNILDFMIVVTGYISLGGMANVTGLRGIRALRPLRTITRIKEMKNLVGSIIACLPMLLDVIVLMTFYFVVFGIMTVQLFSGVLRNRCGAPVFTNATTHASTGIVQGVEYTVPDAWIGGMGSGMCKEPLSKDVTWHNVTDPITGDWSLEASGGGTTEWAFQCPGPSEEYPYGLYCTPWGNPGSDGYGRNDFGYTSFDNILLAWIRLLQHVTLQNWSYIMYDTQEAVNWWTFPLHYTMFLLGGILIVNLILAIIYVNYQKQQNEKLEALERELSGMGSLPQKSGIFNRSKALTSKGNRRGSLASKKGSKKGSLASRKGSKKFGSRKLSKSNLSFDSMSSVGSMGKGKALGEGVEREGGDPVASNAGAGGDVVGGVWLTEVGRWGGGSVGDMSHESNHSGGGGVDKDAHRSSASNTSSDVDDELVVPPDLGDSTATQVRSHPAHAVPRLSFLVLDQHRGLNPLFLPQSLEGQPQLLQQPFLHADRGSADDVLIGHRMKLSRSGACIDPHEVEAASALNQGPRLPLAQRPSHSCSSTNGSAISSQARTAGMHLDPSRFSHGVHSQNSVVAHTLGSSPLAAHRRGSVDSAMWQAAKSSSYFARGIPATQGPDSRPLVGLGRVMLVGSLATSQATARGEMSGNLSLAPPRPSLKGTGAADKDGLNSTKSRKRASVMMAEDPRTPRSRMEAEAATRGQRHSVQVGEGGLLGAHNARVRAARAIDGFGSIDGFKGAQDDRTGFKVARPPHQLSRPTSLHRSRLSSSTLLPGALQLPNDNLNPDNEGIGAGAQSAEQPDDDRQQKRGLSWRSKPSVSGTSTADQEDTVSPHHQVSNFTVHSSPARKGLPPSPFHQASEKLTNSGQLRNLPEDSSGRKGSIPSTKLDFVSNWEGHFSHASPTKREANPPNAHARSKSVRPGWAAASPVLQNSAAASVQATCSRAAADNTHATEVSSFPRASKELLLQNRQRRVRRASIDLPGGLPWDRRQNLPRPGHWSMELPRSCSATDAAHAVAAVMAAAAAAKAAGAAGVADAATGAGNQGSKSDQPQGPHQQPQQGLGLDPGGPCDGSANVANAGGDDGEGVNWGASNGLDLPDFPELTDTSEEDKESEMGFESWGAVSGNSFAHFDTEELEAIKSSGRYGNVWMKFRGICAHVSSSQGFELFNACVIMLNALILGLNWYLMPEELSQATYIVNLSFTVYFVVEFLVRITGQGPDLYYSSGMNWFDFFVTVASFAEMIVSLSGAGSEFNGGLTAIRLLRLFRLARYWTGLNIVLRILGAAFKASAYLLALVLLFMFVMGLLGMQLFGYLDAFCDKFEGGKQVCPPGVDCPPHRDCYVPCDSTQQGQWFEVDGSPYGNMSYCELFPRDYNPRDEHNAKEWPLYLAQVGKPQRPIFNFNDMFHASVTMFILMTLDNWTNVMYPLQKAITPWVAIFFVVTFFIGAFILLQLFLAILLSGLHSLNVAEMAKENPYDIGHLLDSTVLNFARKMSRNLSRSFSNQSMALKARLSGSNLGNKLSVSKLGKGLSKSMSGLKGMVSMRQDSFGSDEEDFDRGSNHSGSGKGSMKAGNSMKGSLKDGSMKGGAGSIIEKQRQGDTSYSRMRAARMADSNRIHPAPLPHTQGHANSEGPALSRKTSNDQMAWATAEEMAASLKSPPQPPTIRGQLPPSAHGTEHKFSHTLQLKLAGLICRETPIGVYGPDGAGSLSCASPADSATETLVHSTDVNTQHPSTAPNARGVHSSHLHASSDKASFTAAAAAAHPSANAPNSDRSTVADPPLVPPCRPGSVGRKARLSTSMNAVYPMGHSGLELRPPGNLAGSSSLLAGLLRIMSSTRRLSVLSRNVRASNEGQCLEPLGSSSPPAHMEQGQGTPLQQQQQEQPGSFALPSYRGIGVWGEAVRDAQQEAVQAPLHSTAIAQGNTRQGGLQSSRAVPPWPVRDDSCMREPSIPSLPPSSTGVSNSHDSSYHTSSSKGLHPLTPPSEGSSQRHTHTASLLRPPAPPLPHQINAAPHPQTALHPQLPRAASPTHASIHSLAPSPAPYAASPSHVMLAALSPSPVRGMARRRSVEDDSARQPPLLLNDSPPSTDEFPSVLQPGQSSGQNHLPHASQPSSPRDGQAHAVDDLPQVPSHSQDQSAAGQQSQSDPMWNYAGRAHDHQQVLDAKEHIGKGNEVQLRASEPPKTPLGKLQQGLTALLPWPSVTHNSSQQARPSTEMPRPSAGRDNGHAGAAGKSGTAAAECNAEAAAAGALPREPPTIGTAPLTVSGSNTLWGTAPSSTHDVALERSIRGNSSGGVLGFSETGAQGTALVHHDSDYVQDLNQVKQLKEEEDLDKEVSRIQLSARAGRSLEGQGAWAVPVSRTQPHPAHPCSYPLAQPGPAQPHPLHAPAAAAHHGAGTPQRNYTSLGMASSSLTPSGFPLDFLLTPSSSPVQPMEAFHQLQEPQPKPTSRLIHSRQERLNETWAETASSTQIHGASYTHGDLLVQELEPQEDFQVSTNPARGPSTLQHSTEGVEGRGRSAGWFAAPSSRAGTPAGARRHSLFAAPASTQHLLSSPSVPLPPNPPPPPPGPHQAPPSHPSQRAHQPPTSSSPAHLTANNPPSKDSHSPYLFAQAGGARASLEHTGPAHASAGCAGASAPRVAGAQTASPGDAGAAQAAVHANSAPPPALLTSNEQARGAQPASPADSQAPPQNGGVQLDEAPCTYVEDDYDQEAGTRHQQADNPADDESPPQKVTREEHKPHNRASTIAKYASTFWMMLSTTTPRSGGTSTRNQQGTWVDGEEWALEDSPDALPTVRGGSGMPGFASPRTGGRLLHRMWEAGRQLQENANQMWANAMKEPSREPRPRSSVDDDQWLGPEEVEESEASATHIEKSMDSYLASGKDVSITTPYSPYSKQAMARAAKMAEQEPEPVKPAMGKRTLSERNALRQSSLGNVRAGLERNVRDVLRGDALMCLRPSNPVRIFCARVVCHRWFEAFIIATVICSCVLLCFDTLSLDPHSRRGMAVYNLDRVVTAIFCVEVIMKIIAFGLFFNGHRSYLRSGWNLIDVFVATISLVVILVQAFYSGRQLMWLRALRALRGLRMLRAASKIQGIQMVLNALRRLLPDLINVLMVGLMFFYIFSVLSVVLLKGTMDYCREGTSPYNTDVLDPYYLVPAGQSIDKQWCQASDPKFAPPRQITTSHYHSPLGVEVPAWNLTTNWARSVRSFDNVVSGIWVLYQMAVIENWSSMMMTTTNTVGIEQQPIRDANQYIAVLYVLFMVVGSLTMMNLVVGVSINKYNEMKSENDGRSPFITPEQHHWLSVQQLLSSTTIEERHLPPKNILRRIAHTCMFNSFMDAFIVTIIVCNTIIMLFAHYNMSDKWEMAIEYTNIAVTAIFVIEMLLKVFAVGLPLYLRSNWNKLDVCVTALSILNVLFEQLANSQASTSTRFLPVLRTLRVARVFRLVKSAKGMRKLLSTLYWSMPATLNVGLVLSMLIYLWIIVGINLFGNQKLIGDDVGLNRHANFAHFPAAMLAMLRFLSGEDWNNMMVDCMQLEDCYLVLHNVTATAEGHQRHFVAGQYLDMVNDAAYIKQLPRSAWEDQCSISPMLAILYFCIYMLVCEFILLQLVVGVILDNIEEAENQDQMAITPDDVLDYVRVWEQLDPYGTHYISVTQLTTLITSVPPPLGVKGHPHMLKRAQRLILSTDIPLRQKTLSVHFMEVLHALAGAVAGAEVPAEEEMRVQKHLAKHLPKEKTVYAASHAYAAMAVTSAIKGFLQREKLLDELEAEGGQVFGDEHEQGAHTDVNYIDLSKPLTPRLPAAGIAFKDSPRLQQQISTGVSSPKWATTRTPRLQQIGLGASSPKCAASHSASQLKPTPPNHALDATSPTRVGGVSTPTSHCQPPLVPTTTALQGFLQPVIAERG